MARRGDNREYADTDIHPFLIGTGRYDDERGQQIFGSGERPQSAIDYERSFLPAHLRAGYDDLIRRATERGYYTTAEMAPYTGYTPERQEGAFGRLLGNMPVIGAGAVLGAGLGGFLPYDGGAGMSIFDAFGAGAGAGAGGGATLPESYWSTLADAGGTVTDAGSQLFNAPAAEATGAGIDLTAQSGIPEALGGGTFTDGSLFPSTLTTPVGGAGTVGTLPTFTSGIGSSAGGAGSSVPTATPPGMWERIINGNGTADDFARLVGTGGSTLLGLLGANNQQNTLESMFNQAQNSPGMQRFNASFAPGYDFTSNPAFQGALDVGAQAAARATSARVGNPVGNPGAYADMQKYITGSLALPQLNTERSQNLTAAGLGQNLAGTFAGPIANANAGTFNALGSGLASLTQPANPFDEFMRNFNRQFNLRTGNEAI